MQEKQKIHNRKECCETSFVAMLLHYYITRILTWLQFWEFLKRFLNLYHCFNTISHAMWIYLNINIQRKMHQQNINLLSNLTVVFELSVFKNLNRYLQQFLKWTQFFKQVVFEDLFFFQIILTTITKGVARRKTYNYCSNCEKQQV